MNLLQRLVLIWAHAITILESMNSQYPDLPIACELSCQAYTPIEVSKLLIHCTKLQAVMIGCATSTKVRVFITFSFIASHVVIDRLIPPTTALDIFHKVKEIRESHPNIKRDQVIYPMLRIGNIHLCQGEIEKALEYFNEVSALN